MRVVSFESFFTSVRISEELSNVLERFKLSNNDIFLVWRDYGANMVAGVRNFGLESLSCFLHTLPPSLNDSIFAQQAVKSIVITNRNILTHFNHSAVAVNKLKDLLEQFRLKAHKLIQDVSTRWNATYYILAQNIEQQNSCGRYYRKCNNGCG